MYANFLQQKSRGYRTGAAEWKIIAVWNVIEVVVISSFYQKTVETNASIIVKRTAKVV